MCQQSIGNFIGTKRREKNLTQEQLAEKLGVSNKTISKWENGKCMPDYSVIELLCKELDISIAELLDGKEKEPNSDPFTAEQMELLLYRTQQIETKVQQMENKKSSSFISLAVGSALAVVISYVNWHSVGWAIIHGLLNWGYVIYYLIRY